MCSRLWLWVFILKVCHTWYMMDFKWEKEKSADRCLRMCMRVWRSGMKVLRESLIWSLHREDVISLSWLMEKYRKQVTYSTRELGSLRTGIWTQACPENKSWVVLFFIFHSVHLCKCWPPIFINLLNQYRLSEFYIKKYCLAVIKWR